jgi:hypothetical protein
VEELRDPDKFLSELRRLGADAMVNYYLLEGVPAFFADNWEQYCAFKAEIAQRFAVHPKTVMLVGSGRWGFSTSPDKFPQAFDKGVERSDLDVVVADPALFDRAWRELCEYEMDEDPKGPALGNLNRRRTMLYEGRLDPAIFPQNMKLRQDWETVFAELSTKNWGVGEPRRVGAWIFRDWRFVQRYYRKSFRQVAESGLHTLGDVSRRSRARGPNHEERLGPRACGPLNQPFTAAPLTSVRSDWIFFTSAAGSCTTPSASSAWS